MSKKAEHVFQKLAQLHGDPLENTPKSVTDAANQNSTQPNKPSKSTYQRAFSLKIGGGQKEPVQPATSPNIPDDYQKRIDAMRKKYGSAVPSNLEKIAISRKYLLDKVTGALGKTFFSHTTSKEALPSILSSSKLKTGASLGNMGQKLRNLDSMSPDVLSNSISMGKDVVYSKSGDKFFAVIKRNSPSNAPTHLGKETLFKGDIPLSTKSTLVAVPRALVPSYKKKFSGYKFIASEDIPKSKVVDYKKATMDPELLDFFLKS